jgi:hypothetical protein
VLSNKRVHSERIYTLSVVMQILLPSGDAQGVRLLSYRLRALAASAMFEANFFELIIVDFWQKYYVGSEVLYW